MPGAEGNPTIGAVIGAVATSGGPAIEGAIGAGKEAATMGATDPGIGHGGRPLTAAAPLDEPVILAKGGDGAPAAATTFPAVE